MSITAKRITAAVLAATLVLSLSACSNWSKRDRNTAIGAGAGAIGGALIDKKKGRGAIIGGVVGAGTGYIIGRDKDKKSGRVQ